jgi:UDP-N-acetylmuramyl tripeptide synthase
LKLAALAEKISVLQKIGDMQAEITGISQDSRKVKKGDLFLCIKGARFDGHQYLKQAAEAGAAAAVVDETPLETFGLAVIRVAEVNSVIKEIAGFFYGYPEKRLKLICSFPTAHQQIRPWAEPRKWESRRIKTTSR